METCPLCLEYKSKTGYIKPHTCKFANLTEPELSARYGRYSHVTVISLRPTAMSEADEIEVPPLPPPIQQAPRPPRKLKPARKQVKPGDVNKIETIQTGKEYSEVFSLYMISIVNCYFIDIWYNKWAGGDREDNYSKCVSYFLNAFCVMIQ